MALRRRSVLGHGLWAEARSGVVSLMLVEFLLDGLARSSLGQGPPGHRPLVGGVCRVLRGVTARSDGGRSGGIVFEATAAASVAECVLGSLGKLRLLLGVVLGAWHLLQVVRLHLQSIKCVVNNHVSELSTIPKATLSHIGQDSNKLARFEFLAVSQNAFHIPLFLN